MFIEKIDNKSKQLFISIPLTNGTGKTRIKSRSYFNQYGIPVATRSQLFTQSCYVEWQIGYDVIKSEEEKLKLTTLQDFDFVGANGKHKTLYELSEYIYYFYKWNVIAKQDLESIKNFLQHLNENDFIDNPNNFAIERTAPVDKNILGIDFYYTQVKYPMLVHKFGKYEILTEIKITEKQYAIGVQPMLYFCFPIMELHAKSNLIGRVAEARETANFVIDKNNINIFLEMLKIFGILSKTHNKDITIIIDTIIK
jgi:hypothetical protein